MDQLENNESLSDELIEEDSEPKRTFNHRVIRHRGAVSKQGIVRPDWLAIHEVHYEDSVPSSVTMEPVSIIGDLSEGEASAIDDMKSTLDRMIGCLEKPILNYDDFVSSAEKNAHQLD